MKKVAILIFTLISMSFSSIYANQAQIVCGMLPNPGQNQVVCQSCNFASPNATCYSMTLSLNKCKDSKDGSLNCGGTTYSCGGSAKLESCKTTYLPNPPTTYYCPLNGTTGKPYFCTKINKK